MQACACGSFDYASLWGGEYVRGSASREEPYPFRLLRCRSCGLVRTDPVPDVAMYDALDFDGKVPHERPWLADAAPGILGSLREAGYAAGAVVDVGCNTGELVAALSELGIEAVGCDVDGAAVAFGRELGRNLTQLNLEREPLGGHFAAAVCIHTLEHTLDPVSVMRSLGDALAPAAPLYVAVPNFGGVAAKVMRADWGYLVPMQHVWQFTLESLRTTVERSGRFELVRSSQRAALEAGDGVKGAILRAAARFNRSDEIRALFRRV